MSGLSKSGVQCKSHRLWHQYRTSLPDDKNLSFILSPYFIQGAEGDISLNRMGLIGLILLADSNLENQISGFNTFISLSAYETLLDLKAIGCYAECGYQIYPVVVDHALDLLKVCKILDPETSEALKRIFSLDVPNVNVEALSTLASYSDHLRDVKDSQYNPSYTMVISGVVYLLMFKELDDETYGIYMHKWWRILCNFLQIELSEDVVEPVTCSVMPPYQACRRIYRFYSDNKVLREHFFVAIDGIREDGNWRYVSDAIMLEASFTELEHINLIIKRIVMQNPSILSHGILSNEIQWLSCALQKTRDFEKIEYLNIYVEHDLSEQLRPNNFPKLIYLACNIISPSDEANNHGVRMPDFKSKPTKDELDDILNRLRSKSVTPAAQNIPAIQAMEELLRVAEHWRTSLLDFESQEKFMLSNRIVPLH